MFGEHFAIRRGLDGGWDSRRGAWPKPDFDEICLTLHRIPCKVYVREMRSFGGEQDVPSSANGVERSSEAVLRWEADVTSSVVAVQADWSATLG